MNTDTIRQAAQAMESELTTLRRHLHSHPELSTREHGTQRYIAQFLESLGIPCTPCADTGLVATITGLPGERVVALRADMDALPIEERADVPYRSTAEGVMHACGHDAHTAILMGCAKLLGSISDRFAGTVKLFFQPAEEHVGGAKRMVASGALDNPKVDAVLGLHVMPTMDYNQIEVRHGTLNAATDSFRLEVLGKKGHGAYPDQCVDAIVIAAQVISGLQTVVSRAVSPLDSAVVTAGSIHGGTAGNIITDEVVITGTIRTSSPAVKARVHARMTETAQGIARGLGGDCRVIIEEGYAPLLNDSRVVDRIAAQAARLLGADNVREKPTMSMGGEDFSYFIEHTPGAFYNLGCRVPGRAPYALHTENFDIDERCLVTGVALQCLCALDLLTQPL